MTKRLSLALALAILPTVSGAQDASGIYGNVYGCTVAAFPATGWTQLTSADLRDTSTGTALASGLYLSSLSIVFRSPAFTASEGVARVGSIDFRSLFT